MKLAEEPRVYLCILMKTRPVNWIGDLLPFCSRRWVFSRGELTSIESCQTLIRLTGSSIVARSQKGPASSCSLIWDLGVIRSRGEVGYCVTSLLV